MEGFLHYEFERLIFGILRYLYLQIKYTFGLTLQQKNNNNNTVKPCFMDARLIPPPQGLLWISSDRDDRRFHARREVSDDEA